MKTVVRILFALLIVLAIDACKTQEPAPVANYYKPVFDQTNKTYVRTKKLEPEQLDTLVLLRPNIRDEIAVFDITLSVDEVFDIIIGELAVPVELINAKPPTYDTFLVAADYVFAADYVDMLFPVLPDSMLKLLRQKADTALMENVVDEVNAEFLQEADSLGLTEMVDDLVEEIDTVSVAEEEDKPTSKPVSTKKHKKRKKKKKEDFSEFLSSVVKSKEEIQAEKTRKQIDRNLQLSEQRKQIADSLAKLPAEPVAENLLVDSVSLTMRDSVLVDSALIVEPKIVKLFYTRGEILDDTTRDLFDAENMLDNLLDEAPWQIGDSIPFLVDFPTYYVDSTLKLSFDTVFVEVFDSSKIIPQLPFDQLCNEIPEQINEQFKMVTHDEIVFRIFHPDEEDIYIDMVRVEGGDFKIGSDFFDEDERPAYKVSVSSFLMGKFEVTNKLFCNILNDRRCDKFGRADGLLYINMLDPATKIIFDPQNSRFVPADGYDDYPVVNVTWDGARLFCSEFGGRLPSEAEWEYAAHGGVYARRSYTDREHTDYEYVNRFAGGNYLHDYGWFVDNSRGQVWVGGRKLSNELGLYDMCGNVWEWCYDKYNAEFYKRNSKSRDPMCLEGANVRVNRGGSWSSDAMYCRITNRNFLSQFEQNQYLGFRYMREWK